MKIQSLFLIVAALAMSILTSACADRCNHGSRGPRGGYGPAPRATNCTTVHFLVSGDWDTEEIAQVVNESQARGRSIEEVKYLINQQLPGAHIEVVQVGGGGYASGRRVMRHPNHVEYCGPAYNSRASLDLRLPLPDPLHPGNPGELSIKFGKGGHKPFFGMNHPPEGHGVFRDYKRAPSFEYSDAGHFRVRGSEREYVRQVGPGLYVPAPAKKPRPFGK